MTYNDNDGSIIVPSYGYQSEKSLGWYRSAASGMGLSYGQLQLPDGTALAPSRTFSSESSLGWYRSAASTIANSYGTLSTTSIRLSGNLVLGAVGNMLQIKNGTNSSFGTATLSVGSVNVANSLIAAGDVVFLTDQTAGGTLGDIELGGIRAGSGFTILSTSVTDTSTVAWMIVRAAV